MTFLKCQDIFLYCFIPLETLVDREAEQVPFYNVLQVNELIPKVDLLTSICIYLTTLHYFSLFSIHDGPKEPYL